MSASSAMSPGNANPNSKKVFPWSWISAPSSGGTSPAANLFLNQKIYDIPEHDFQEMKMNSVELLDLKELLTVPVKNFHSANMKAELACALLHRPGPASTNQRWVSTLSRKKLRQFIKDYNQRYSATILLTSHYMIDVEELCKRVIIIDTGQILYDGDLHPSWKIRARQNRHSRPQNTRRKSFAPYGRVRNLRPHRPHRVSAKKSQNPATSSPPSPSQTCPSRNCPSRKSSAAFSSSRQTQTTRTSPRKIRFTPSPTNAQPHDHNYIFIPSPVPVRRRGGRGKARMGGPLKPTSETLPPPPLTP